MNSEKFKKWLQDEGKKTTTIQNRISNCRNVEKFEGDLDKHYLDDYGLSLLEKLSYSKSDEKYEINAKHNIPINGNIREGSSTLKSATSLYFTYKKSSDSINIIDYSESSSDNFDFDYEKELNNSMVKNIKSLFPEYKIFGKNNEGVEYIIENKRIDILVLY